MGIQKIALFKFPPSSILLELGNASDGIVGKQASVETKGSTTLLNAEFTGVH